MRRPLTFLLALIAGAANATPVTLVWDPPVGYVPAGYIVGYGEVSGVYSTEVDVGAARTFSVPDLASGRTYYFSVKAYAGGESSAWASEVAVAALSEPPPLATSLSPVVGLWDNGDEPGTGYSLDFKHGILVVLVFTYTTSGAPQWYIASGPLIGSTFTGRLDKFASGPCISCGFAGGPTATGNDGDIRIVFSAASSATVYLPGGRIVPIRPTPF